MLDMGPIISDLLRVLALGLFGLSAFYVRGLADSVKDLRKEHGDRLTDHGERIARIEGQNGA